MRKYLDLNSINLLNLIDFIIILEWSAITRTARTTVVTIGGTVLKIITIPQVRLGIAVINTIVLLVLMGE